MIEDRLQELEKIYSDVMNEMLELQKKQEDEKIKKAISSEILGEGKWNIDRVLWGPPISLSGRVKDFPKLYKVLMPGHHDAFTTKELTIHFDDEDVDLTFRTTEDLISFIRKYNLKMGDRLKDSISALKEVTTMLESLII